MKKFTLNFKTFLLLLVCLTAAQNIKSQTAYVLSDIVYDNITGKVSTYSGTYLDYAARVHYDPAVCGRVYQQFTLVGSRCQSYYNASYDLPNQRVYGSLVSLRSVNPAPPDTRYDILSDHYVIAYFQGSEPVIIDETGVPGLQRKWYDPLSFNQNNGQSDGWQSYAGRPDYTFSQFWEEQYFYLGTTGKGIIANPTSCPNSIYGDPSTAECSSRSASK